MNSNLYTIEAISNLHAGSGDVNYGVVDNLIQRDAITDLPVINSSSLKGAFREHCKTSLREEEIAQLFGSDPKSSDRKVGSYRFFDAYLLAMPVRSDKSPFLMATCPMILEAVLNKNELFNIGLSNQMKNVLHKLISLKSTYQVPLVFCEDFKEASIEDLNEILTKYQKIEGIEYIGALMGNAPLVLVDDKEFRILCDNNHLPVIARNYLNNGKSENLFYEQVLPRLSRLYFILMHPDRNDHEKLNGTLKDTLVQIGANASVGYGYCKITPFDNLNK